MMTWVSYDPIAKCAQTIHKPGTSPGAFYCRILILKLPTYNTNTSFGEFLSLYNRKVGFMSIHQHFLFTKSMHWRSTRSQHNLGSSQNEMRVCVIATWCSFKFEVWYDIATFWAMYKQATDVTVVQQQQHCSSLYAVFQVPSNCFPAACCVGAGWSTWGIPEIKQWEQKTKENRRWSTWSQEEVLRKCSKAT